MKRLTLDEYTHLIRDHQASVRVFVRSLGVCADMVDDIAQEAFLLAWREKDRFDPEGDFGRWAKGFARRLVANERRKAVRRSRLLSEHLSEILDQTVGEEEPFAPCAAGLFATAVRKEPFSSSPALRTKGAVHVAGRTFGYECGGHSSETGSHSPDRTRMRGRENP